MKRPYLDEHEREFIREARRSQYAEFLLASLEMKKFCKTIRNEIKKIVNYNTKKDNRTKLQKKFEEQTPTIKNIKGKEYLQIYCTWLELQVEKERKNNS